MTTYQLTLNFDNVTTLQQAIAAVAGVVPADPTITKVDDAANENPAAKARAKKPANGKATEDKPADSIDQAADDLAAALKICRALLDSGDAAKADLKALRDEFGVKKLSDVPPEGSASFLAKAQALQDKHSA